MPLLTELGWRPGVSAALTAGRRSNPQARCLRYVPDRSPAKTETRIPSESRNPASEPTLRHPPNATPSLRLAQRIRNRENS